MEQHPGFLTRHSNLLENVELQHGSGEVASLIEHQVKRLREKNADLARQLKQLVQIAGDNEKLMSRLHRLTLNLIPIDELSDFFKCLVPELEDEFSADSVFIGLFCAIPDIKTGSSVRELSDEDPGIQQFSKFLESEETACGRLNQEKKTFLFGDFAAEIKSTAMVPLGNNAEYGFFAIGSQDPSRFYPGMGTLFLELLGDIVSHRLEVSKLEPHRRSA